MDKELDRVIEVNQKWDLNNAKYIIVNGVIIFSGFITYIGNANKKGSSCELFKVVWSRDVVTLRTEAKMWAPCNNSMHGPLRTHSSKYRAKVEIWIAPTGIVEMRNNGHDTPIPKTIFLSGLYAVMDFAQAPNHTWQIKDPFELTITSPSPQRWTKHPTVDMRGNMAFMSGGQGADDTRYTADGLVLCRYPPGTEPYLPAPKQALRYDVPCGWSGKPNVVMKIGDDGTIRAYGHSHVGDAPMGHILYDHVAYSTDKGEYVDIANNALPNPDEDEMNGWGSDSDKDIDELVDENDFTKTSITFRQVKGCVFFLQGHIDLRNSPWKEGRSIARIKFCPLVREVYQVQGHRIDVAPDGHIFLPEDTHRLKHSPMIDFNIFVVATKRSDLTDASGDRDDMNKIIYMVINIILTFNEECPTITGVLQWGKRRQWEYSSSRIKDNDRERFLKVQKFFLDHDTNGKDITHPSLTGSYQNDFSSTSKNKCYLSTGTGLQIRNKCSLSTGTTLVFISI